MRRFPLILTAKFHSLYVKESGILESRCRIFYLRLRNPDRNKTAENFAELKPFASVLSSPRFLHRQKTHTRMQCRYEVG